LLAATMQQAVAAMREHGREASLFAGGTDLLVGMKESRNSPKYLVDIKRLPELNTCTYDDKTGLRLGGATQIRQIETSQLIQQRYRHLAMGAGAVGSIQIRHRATVGGNICNASPCGDTIPNLMVSDARLFLQGANGGREVGLEEFFVGPGRTVLNDEVLVEIRIPPPGAQSRSSFSRISRRNALDLALVSVAVKLDLPAPDAPATNVRVALAAVGPTVFRAKNTEKLLEGRVLSPQLLGEAARSAADEAKPIDDVRASAWYRREMVAALCRRALKQVIEEARCGK
jgi:carbon-monoxide dehydrogenase medium subunit